MKSIATILVTAAATAGSVVVLATAAKAVTERSSVPDRPAEQIARGNYLVHRVGMCIDCHSPRNEKGEFLEGKHLTGSPLGFTPVVPMPWAPVAPRIAGLPAGFTQEDTVHFLMTGERPQGRPGPLPPMPPFRFNRDDAEAITAYLSSLPHDEAQR